MNFKYCNEEGFWKCPKSSKHQEQSLKLSIVPIFEWQKLYGYLLICYYSQTRIYGHPLNTDTSLFTDSLLCPWEGKASHFLWIQPAFNIY